MKTLILTIAFSALAAGASAQSGMSQADLEKLTRNGITLTLGGEGQGYSGSLKLNKNGKGRGSATLDNGNKINLQGAWVIRNGQFCRTWKGIDNGQEVCETWVLTSGRSVDVYNGDQKIGVNSW